MYKCFTTPSNIVNPIYQLYYPKDYFQSLQNSCFYINFQMKKFQEKPIPLIVRHEGKKYQVNPQAIKFFSSIQGKIALISVAGVYRTGKSYLLNTIILKQKNGFAVGPTTNPKTKGIWVWGKPLTYKNENDEIINVCVLDSQGLGSIQEDINHDLRLFSLTLLLSSMFLYNTLGAIDQNAIDSLGLVLKLCEHLKAENYNDFPDFYWILRDFSLALVDKDNKPLTSNKYLQNALSSQAGDSEMRNRIRQSIRNSFTHRSCFTFVRPLMNEQELQKLDTLQLDQLRPQFTEQVIDFRKLINANIKTKRIKGKEINSHLLIELINVYVAQINGQQMPQIETGWRYVCIRECQHALTTIEKEVDESINKMMVSLPTTKKELNEKKQIIYQQLKQIFALRTQNNDQAANFFGQISQLLQKRISRVEEEMKLKNAQQTKGFIKKQFENIEKRLKSGQFKSMGELVKQFQLFYQYYRKKCPYKDQIQTGLQFLMKKFSDSSLLMFKNFKTRKDQQTFKLRQELEKIVSQLSTREEKYKHQKVVSSDKVAISESRIQQLIKQNQLLTDNLSRLEIEYQKITTQHQENASTASEEIEYEVLSLRKKLMEAEDQLRSIQCIKMIEMNNFRNSLILKDNEITHIKQEISNLSTKLSAMTLQLQNEREEKQSKYEKLFESTQILKEENQKLKRSREVEIQQKNMQISNLQNNLQSKSLQIANLIQSNSRQIKAYISNFESQKLLIQQGFRDEMKSIKQISLTGSEEHAMKIRKVESDISQRELELRMHRLELDKESAILNQKLQFLKKQCNEKEQKIIKLQEQNFCYMSIFQEKDGEISNLSVELQELRNMHDTSYSESVTRLEEQSQLIQEKLKRIQELEEIQEKLKIEIRQKGHQIKSLNDKLKNTTKSYEEKLKQLAQKLNFEIESGEKSNKSLQNEIQALKAENSKIIDDQKRNAELSLVQLKNYYQMEKQRLEKKNLQDRKKHQYTENSAVSEIQNKHRKVQRMLQEELQQFKLKYQSLQEELSRVENDCQLRILSVEEDSQNQIRILENRGQLLEKKINQLQNQYDIYEKNNEEQRICFVKKIQGLNFELSRKEKEFLQLTSKKESLQGTLIKRETQIENVKKLMNQQIEGSMKKVSEIQTKYQKLNEEYMHLKFESQKQIALSKQRNEFLNAKLQDLTKEKEINSSKNIERIDKQKITDLKDQNQKHRSELMSLQAKLEIQRKAQKQHENNYTKKITALQRDNEFLAQKELINLQKISDLQSKIQQKTELFLKDLEETRKKYMAQKEVLQKEGEQLRQKFGILEDESSAQAWNLQKDIALLHERIKYAEYQRDQIRKQLQQSQKKHQTTLGQLKKVSEKSNEDSDVKRNQTDKRLSGQIEKIKQDSRNRLEQYQQNSRKQRDEIRQLKDKIVELNQRIHASEKIKNVQKSLQDENDNLRREKQNLMTNYRSQRSKQNQEWKRKLNQCQKKSKEYERKNMQNIFIIEKQNSKWSMERQNLLEKIKGLEDSIEWQKNKPQMNKSRLDLKKSESSNNFTNERGFGSWK